MRTPLLVLTGALLGAPLPARAQDRPVDVALTEGTNIAAALSPDGRTIALDLLGRIWTLPRAGGTARALTDELGDARQPAWSPDGQRVAFQSYRDGTWHIWSVGADGSDLRQHTVGEFDDREPDWSFDGRSLYFSSDRSGNYDIWRLDLASERLERITSDPADDYAPAVSRDGAAIAFVSRRATPPGPGIWVHRADGAEEGWAAARGQVNAPSWSPDGRAISYNLSEGQSSALLIADRGGAPRTVSAAGEDVFPFRAAWLTGGGLLYTANGGIQEINPAGQRAGRVPFEARIRFTRPAYRRDRHDFDGPEAHPVRGIVAPAISPDGARIAFTALGDLWVLAQGQATRLTDDPALQADPMWSPDGRQLVYASDQGGAMELWLRDLATGRSRQLTRGVAGAAWPAWSPDGSAIVFQVQVGLGTEIRMLTVATGEMTTLRKDLFQPSRASFSPDGRLVAIAALRPNSGRFREGRHDVLVLSLDGGGDRWVSPMGGRGLGSRGIDGPVWSPDGRRLAFVAEGLLWALPVSREGDPVGPPVRLSAELAGALTWTADSRRLLYQVNDGLRLVDLGSGRTESLAVPLTWRRRNPTRRIVVHAGRLWDGLADTARRNQDIVIEGHRIARVVPHSPSLHRDSVVDASAHTVLPGLADAHTHLGYGTGEALGRIWLAFGITTIRDPASDGFIIRERREAVESGVRVGPRELATGSIFDGPRIYYGFNNPITAGAQLEQELERADRLGYDFLKTYVRLPDAVQRRIIEFAHRHGLAVSSHELYPAVAFGADHVEHIRGTSRRGYSPKVTALYHSYQDVITLLTASGMSLTPTIGIQGGFFNLLARNPSLLDDPRVTATYGQEYVDGLRGRLGRFAGAGDPIRVQGETVRRVIAGGGRVIAGTDSPIVPYGLSLHTELEHYVEGGLTPVQALRTATSMFAEAMGLDRDLGSVAPGRLADLAIVEGDPLATVADARRVRIVIKNGDVFTEERLLAGPLRPAPAPARAPR